MARSDNVLELIIEAIDRTAPGFSKVTARMAKLTQEFPVLSAAAGLAAQAIVGQLARIAAGLVDSYNEVVKVGAALDDMTKRIDLSAEKLSSWEYVMQTSGGTLGNFESGVTKLREQMAAVAGGSKEATKKFSDLGVSAKDAYGNLKPVEAVLLDISTALKGATSDSVKMAAANTLLGGEKALVGSLAEGPEEIQRKLRLVQALNGEMSAEFAKSSSAVADAQTNLSFAWRGLKSDVAQAVNWDAALAANKLAMVVAAVSGHLDDLERMMEDTREALKEPLFPGVAAYNQGPDVMLKNMETANREALVRAAAEFKVSAKKTVFDPKTFKFIDVDKTAEQIAADITAARERGIQQARSQAERDEAAETRRRERIRLEQIKDFKITGRPDAPVNTRALGPPEPKDQPITDFEQLKLDLKDMTEFSAREFANMALNIGDTFADVVSDVGAHLLGLREGPMMIGRAFKAMAASIMADLARIIARMLVARALLSLFNWGTTGGGVFGGALRGMAGNSGGGIVKTASSGLTVSGTSVDSLFPAVILPGSPGLDRTPVLAHGGEMLVPRQRVNATERMLGKVQSSPRHAVAPRSSRGRDRLGFLVNRPFRTTESIDLRNSVLEGIARGERYDV